MLSQKSLSVGVWGYNKKGQENQYGDDAWFVSGDCKAIGVADGTRTNYETCATCVVIVT